MSETIKLDSDFVSEGAALDIEPVAINFCFESVKHDFDVAPKAGASDIELAA